MLDRYFLILLSSILVTSCSSSKTANPSFTQPVNAPPISVNTPANASESKLDVWSTEIEICHPKRLKPCSPIKANTLGKPTEIGFLYYQNNFNKTPIQNIQAPLAKMPVVIPQKGALIKSENFNMAVFLKSNGSFSTLETPSASPNFFPLRFSNGYYGSPENFYKEFDGISYTIKSMTQLDGQQQAAIIVDSTTSEKSAMQNDPYHSEFRAEDTQEIFSGAVTPKPQQVEPIVIGQRVGLKKW